MNDPAHLNMTHLERFLNRVKVLVKVWHQVTLFLGEHPRVSTAQGSGPQSGPPVVHSWSKWSTGGP